MRVPPGLGDASNGNRSAVARSMAPVIRSAAATPIEPARNLKSHTTTATRRPKMRPSPVATDSSRPLASRASARLRAYACDIGTCSGSLSQLRKEPSSSTASRNSSVVIRLTAMRLYTLAPMIGITHAQGVMTIELQRPERRNALNSQLVEELREAFLKAGDGTVRAIVLTGQGTAFCAGADLSGDAFAADYPDRLVGLNPIIALALVPVIGAINGPAIGAGLQLAMQCDLRVVASDA